MSQINENLRKFIRSEIKNWLAMCTEGERGKFMSMYDKNKTGCWIKTVDNMVQDDPELSTPEHLGRLNNAMMQVSRTLSKRFSQ